MRLEAVLNLAKEYMLLGILLLITFILGYIFIYKKLLKGRKKLSKNKIPLKVILAIYIIIVLGATLGSRHSNIASVNLHLFSSYKEAYNSFSMVEWRTLILNILMFIPLGFMIPLLFDKAKKWHTSYFIGFLLTLSIEAIQFITKRGSFDIDDIINNALGYMIGYGIVMIFISVYNKNNKVLASLMYQIPLIITIITFSTIFVTYSKKELGNLSITHIYNVDMSTVDVFSKVNFDDKLSTAYVYKAPVGNKEEALKFANEFFSLLNTKVDESQNDEYDETTIFNSEDNNYKLWVNYKGFTTWFINNSSEYNGKENLSYKDIQNLLSKYNINLPNEAKFEDCKDGNYKITVDMVKSNNNFLDGELNCQISKDNTVYSIKNDIISYEPYKEYDILSLNEAYNKIKNGEFKSYDLEKESNKIDIIDGKLDYKLDSKGFYQPIYTFNVEVNGSLSEIEIPALKK